MSFGNILKTVFDFKPKKLKQKKVTCAQIEPCTSEPVCLMSKTISLSLKMLPPDIVAPFPSPEGFEDLICIYSASLKMSYIFDVRLNTVVYSEQSKPLYFLRLGDKFLLRNNILHSDRDAGIVTQCGKLEEE